MPYTGIVIHHSACPSINGKGFDFFVAKDGTIIPSEAQTDPDYIHVCLEGDYSALRTPLIPQQIEQLFVLKKLLQRLLLTFELNADDLYPHTMTCPGERFPWSELVISTKDRYH